MSIEPEDTINQIKPVESESPVPAEKEVPVAKAKYEVISVENVDTPEGMVGDHWFRYIIGEGGGKIEGLREGTLKEVTLHANNIAEDLNIRSKGKVAAPLARKQNPTPPEKKS
ncbi:MAG: hypothetical protein QM484_08790 [Woeseiaceae bacterium]